MEIYPHGVRPPPPQKAAASKGKGAAAVMIDAAACYSSLTPLDAWTTSGPYAAVHEGDMLRTQLAMLKRLGEGPAVDTIALRRRIADAVHAAPTHLRVAEALFLIHDRGLPPATNLSSRPPPTSPQTLRERPRRSLRSVRQTLRDQPDWEGDSNEHGRVL